MDNPFEANGKPIVQFQQEYWIWEWMLKQIRNEVEKHPVFFKNCKSNIRRNAKICLDCPFRKLGILEP